MVDLSKYPIVQNGFQPDGYSMRTTFWDDFTIADHFGQPAVMDTFLRASANWAHDVVYATELCMVLNWKIWQFSQTNEPLARLYDKLWKRYDAQLCRSLQGEELEYFLRTTD